MRVGIIGGGQLARMLVLAGYPLGLRFTVVDPAADACAAQVAEFIHGAYDDPRVLQQLAEQVDIVTFDFENVPVAAARQLAQQLPVYPPAEALAMAQDRLHEKNLFNELEIPTPAYVAVDSLDGLRVAVEQLGLPAVLKTRRLGYDGKGQRVLNNVEDIVPAWQALGGTPLILESFVAFEREVSILALRDRQGGSAFYPLTENRHRDGILRVSRAPHPNPELTSLAQDYAIRLLRRLDYVGLLAIEFFVTQDNQLLANEMAPRVHNSGHWTIEGALTSQFENHLRAVTGLPLGDTAARGYAAMLNFIGELPAIADCLAVSDAHYHAYGKAPRAGRKLGHLTLCASDPDTLHRRLRALTDDA